MRHAWPTVRVASCALPFALNCITCVCMCVCVCMAIRRRCKDMQGNARKCKEMHFSRMQTTTALANANLSFFFSLRDVYVTIIRIRSLCLAIDYNLNAIGMPHLHTYVCRNLAELAFPFIAFDSYRSPFAICLSIKLFMPAEIPKPQKSRWQQKNRTANYTDISETL